MENSTWAAGRHDVSCCRSERAQKTPELKPATFYLWCLRAERGRRRQGASRRSVWAPVTHCLSLLLPRELERRNYHLHLPFVPDIWHQEITTWEKVLSASTYISYLAQKAAKKSTPSCWMAWDSVDTWYLLLTIISTTIVTYYLWVSHDFWC